MDIVKAFTFVADDEEWVTKLGIGVLLSFLSFFVLPIFLLVGYMIATTRNVKNGLARPLPQWDNWERLFMDGLYVVVAQLVYTLPFWLLMCLATIVTVGVGGAGGMISEEAAGMGIVATWGVAGCLLLFMMIALFFISPAIVLQYVRTEEFGSLFRFGEVLSIARDNVANILIVTAVTFAASLVLSVILGALQIIPCLGTLIAMVIGIVSGPWLIAATGHMYGQIAGGMDKFASYKQV